MHYSALPYFNVHKSYLDAVYPVPHLYFSICVQQQEKRHVWLAQVKNEHVKQMSLSHKQTPNSLTLILQSHLFGAILTPKI